jgi:hypothetical protein
MGIGTFIIGEIKGPGHELGRSPPSTGSIKKAWSYSSVPSDVFMAWYLIKAMSNFNSSNSAKSNMCTDEQSDQT